MTVDKSLNVTLEIRDEKGNYALHGTDPVCTRRLLSSGLHHMAVVVDNGPFLIYFMVDGLVCDGGPTMQTGFTWITNDVSRLSESLILQS